MVEMSGAVSTELCATKLLAMNKVVDVITGYLQGFCGVCLVLWCVIGVFVLIVLDPIRFCFLEVEPEL